MRSLFKSLALSTILLSSIQLFAQGTKNVSVKNFDQISVSSGIDLYLTQGSTESLSIKADESIINNVVVEQSGSKLTIKFNDQMKWGNPLKNRETKVYVNYKSLTNLAASGGSDVFSQNQMKLDKISIQASGGADLKLNLVCNDLVLQSSGGSDVDLKGKSENMILHTSGGSDVDAFDFITSYAKVEASGGSDANIYVSKGLEAGASGGSDIRYKGGAALKKTSSSKSGDITRVQ